MSSRRLLRLLASRSVWLALVFTVPRSAGANPREVFRESLGLALSSRSFRYTDTSTTTDLEPLVVPVTPGVVAALESRLAWTRGSLLAPLWLAGRVEVQPWLRLQTAAGTTMGETLRARLNLKYELPWGPFLLAPTLGYALDVGRTQLESEALSFPGTEYHALSAGLEARIAFERVTLEGALAYRTSLDTGELGTTAWFAGAHFIGVELRGVISYRIVGPWAVGFGMTFDQVGLDFNPLDAAKSPEDRAGGATDRLISFWLVQQLTWNDRPTQLPAADVEDF